MSRQLPHQDYLRDHPCAQTFDFDEPGDELGGELETLDEILTGEPGSQVAQNEAKAAEIARLLGETPPVSDELTFGALTALDRPAEPLPFWHARGKS